MKFHHKIIIVLAVVGLSTIAAPGQILPATTQSDATYSSVQTLLQMMHDRRATLKDFSAKMSYEVYHPRTDDKEGKRGTVEYADDPSMGQRFFVHSTVNTVDGKPYHKIDEDIAFDGSTLTTIDHTGRHYMRTTVAEKNARPGSATALDGPIPLPIGIPMDDVFKAFDVTLLPSSAPGASDLRFVPHDPTRFGFTQLDVTIDQKLQLPIKLVETSSSGDVTTILFSDPVINGGSFTFPDTSAPKESGWDIVIK